MMGSQCNGIGSIDHSDRIISRSHHLSWRSRPLPIQGLEKLVLAYSTMRIKRCGEMARKLRLFKEQMTKNGVSPSARSTGDSDVDLDNLEVKLAELEAELLEVNANNEKLQHTYSELLESKLVLQKAGEFFSSAQNSSVAHQRKLEVHKTAEGSIDSPLLLEEETTTDPSKQINLGFISGLFAREKSIPFERIFFRATRG